MDELDEKILGLTENLLAVTERLKENVGSHTDEGDWYNAWIITSKNMRILETSNHMKNYLLLEALTRELKSVIPKMKNHPKDMFAVEVFAENSHVINWANKLSLDNYVYDPTLVKEYHDLVGTIKGYL